MSALMALIEKQRKRVPGRRWSENGGYGDYLAELNDNFLDPMHQDVLVAYGTGAGDELPAQYDAHLGRAYRLHQGRMLPSKMQAIHSSSALVCNAFGYWYARKDRSPFGKALGIEAEIDALRFEDKKPTGLRGTPPHLDVGIYCGSKVYAVESKFSEPYQGE